MQLIVFIVFSLRNPEGLSTLVMKSSQGFTDWKHASKVFKDHIGGHGSKHNSCVKHYDDYNNQRQSVASNFAISSKESEEMYKIRVM